jgi:iron(III) transport system ATP-binding protein
LSALDARVRAHLRTELRQLHQRLGVTTIMVTHDQEEALSLADRIVVMNHGVIEQVGTPQTIYQQPCSAFVADFVGKTNPLPARLSGPGRANWHGLELACEHLPHLPDHTEVTLTVRPEDIVLHPHSEHDNNPENHDTLQAPLHASNRLRATVHNLEFLGPFCRVSMHLAQNGQILVADVPTAQALHMGLAAQRRLTIDLPARHIRVYGAHARAH